MHLGDLKHPNELHGLSPAQLEDVARQIRERQLQVVSTSGGHLGPGLGVVEQAPETAMPEHAVQQQQATCPTNPN